MSTNDLCAPLIITVSDTIPLDTGCDARSISDIWDTCRMAEEHLNRTRPEKLKISVNCCLIRSLELITIMSHLQLAFFC